MQALRYAPGRTIRGGVWLDLCVGARKQQREGGMGKADQERGGQGKAEEARGGWRLKDVALTYFPMLIAVLSLVTSIYNGYLNGRFVDLVQNNVARVEYMKTCKDVIDAYFMVKLRAGEVVAAGSIPSPVATRETLAAREAAARLAALNTYLANLRDEAVRVRYTEFSGLIEKAVEAAGRTPAGEAGKLWAAPDRIFQELNDDCVKSARAQRM